MFENFITQHYLGHFACDLHDLADISVRIQHVDIKLLLVPTPIYQTKHNKSWTIPFKFDVILLQVDCFIWCKNGKFRRTGVGVVQRHGVMRTLVVWYFHLCWNKLNIALNFNQVLGQQFSWKIITANHMIFHWIRFQRNNFNIFGVVVLLLGKFDGIDDLYFRGWAFDNLCGKLMVLQVDIEVMRLSGAEW